MNRLKVFARIFTYDSKQLGPGNEIAYFCTTIWSKNKQLLFREHPTDAFAHNLLRRRHSMTNRVNFGGYSLDILWNIPIVVKRLSKPSAKLEEKREGVGV